MYLIVTVQLGNITSANAFNPLKINLFYKNFNTVIILDNRLAEIFKIDFNTVQPYKNVSHISTGYDNTLWIFNPDLQQLELFDYKTNQIRCSDDACGIECVRYSKQFQFLLVADGTITFTSTIILEVLFLKFQMMAFTKIAEDNGNLVIYNITNYVYFAQRF